MRTVPCVPYAEKRTTLAEQYRAYHTRMAELIQHKAWEVVPPEQPYGSLKALLQAEIGCTEEEARQRWIAKDTGSSRQGGRPKKTDNLPVLTQQARTNLANSSSRTGLPFSSPCAAPLGQAVCLAPQRVKFPTEGLDAVCYRRRQRLVLCNKLEQVM
jgi:hypothetical protein